VDRTLAAAATLASLSCTPGHTALVLTFTDGRACYVVDTEAITRASAAALRADPNPVCGIIHAAIINGNGELTLILPCLS
jgi:hypothetical protein